MKAIFCIFAAVAFLHASAADNATRIEARIDEILDKASSKRYDANTMANRDYRAAVATTFQFADRIEVYLLDFSIGKDPGYQPTDNDETFPIRPYNEAKTKVLKKARLPVKDIPAWCAAVTKMLTSDKEEGGALCHYPIHGIRIFAGTRLLFETSICWACRNYYFTYDRVSEWKGLTEDSDALSKMLHDFMPIPEAEMKRLPGGNSKAK